ncbi:MAG: hypothetical protein ABSA59_11245 [Terriglobia bacterium]|jgi:hypothetical protein
MPKTIKTGMKHKASYVSDKVFLNIPYDKRFEPLYLAFIAGLSGFGLIPQAVLQIPESERRLVRILSLIRQCKISFHDLSRVNLDPKPPRTPRFNMPFELGLAVAWQRIGKRSHRWYVFEAEPHRLQKSLSDLNGTDPYIHHYQPDGVLQQLTDALIRVRHRPTVMELEAILDDLKKAAVKIKRGLRTKSLFGSRAFEDLVLAAQRIARTHVASLRQTTY